MPQHEQTRMQWDKLAVAQTRPAMSGGVPFWAVFPVFFLPGILTVITFKVYIYLPMIPVLWVLVKLAYLGNHNRPFEWLIWLTSGAFLADWDDWGGMSDNPKTQSERDGIG